MKRNGLSGLLIIQAILAILLLFASGFLTTVNMVIILLLDIVIVFGLFKNKWQSSELFTFASVFTSVLFILFIMFMSTSFFTLLVIGIAINFFISSMLLFDFSEQRMPKMKKPMSPDSYPMMMDLEQESIEIPKYSNSKYNDSKYMSAKSSDMNYSDLYAPSSKFDEAEYKKPIKPTPAPAKIQEHKIFSKSPKIHATNDDMSSIREKEDELIREALELERAEKQFKTQVQRSQNFQRDEMRAELLKEAAEMQNAEKQLRSQIQRTQREELIREAAQMQNAESQIKKIQEKSNKDKTYDNAMLYELQREAAELQRAEGYVEKKQASHSMNSLKEQAEELMKAEKSFAKKSAGSINTKLSKLKNEAMLLEGAEARARVQTSRARTSELQSEAKKLEDAENSLRKLEELSKIEKRIDKNVAQVKKVTKPKKIIAQNKIITKKIMPKFSAPKKTIANQAKRMEIAEKKLTKFRSDIQQKSLDRQAKELMNAQKIINKIKTAKKKR